ncbi:hypothetical protein [Bradyrhizobium sp. Arg816]|uniref:hypothetical protein n=1 Tax=Bradyrhizobium sp. Arg816 TaxID=2998491 RepID=UPI00249EB43D|nr:hypothetical protein [Bradyrhizobium sp. Arg816]MDI3563574.1 hypothetical protein [Bradyrhizobium sp. Arg816]
MQTGDLDDQLTKAKISLSQLSTYARSVGDLPTMYAANRAWHELDAADRDLSARRATQSNGVRNGDA